MTPGDLAWLWGKIRPRDPQQDLSRLYLEPEARDEDLQQQVSALFTHYPEGEE